MYCILEYPNSFALMRNRPVDILEVKQGNVYVYL